METRLLKYTREVYRQQSFTKAADRLRIAQPSLSQQIAKFEKELGVRLFFRRRGKVTPTPEGIHFLKKADHILQMIDDLEREIQEQSEGMGTELTIGTTVITGGHVLPPLLQSYQALYPNVHVRLVEEATAKLTELTATGDVDLCILSLPVEDSRLTTKTMLTEPLFLALPRVDKEWMSEEVRSLITSPDIHPTVTLPLTKLSTAPFILLKKGYGFRQTTFALCAENGFQPRIAFETSSIQTALSLVTYGLGVTLVPEMVARNNREPLYVSLRSNPTRTIVFAYNKDRYLNKAAKAFLNMYEKKTSS